MLASFRLTFAFLSAKVCFNSSDMLTRKMGWSVREEVRRIDERNDIDE